MRRSKFLLALGAVFAVAGMTASGAFASVDPAGKKPLGVKAPSGTVIFGADQEPRTLNTFTNEGNAAWGRYVTQPVMAPGIMYDNNGKRVNYVLESSRVVSESPFVVEYKIRAAARWSDGRPITAEDLAFTAALVNNTNWSIASRAGYEDIARIQTVNPKTARFHFKKVYAPWRDLIGTIYPAHAAGGLVGANFDQAYRESLPLASGPFRFVDWRRGSQMVLQQNPNFWGKKATVNQIVFRFIPDTNTQFQALRGGEVNITHPQPQQQIADASKQSNLTVQRKAGYTWEHIDLQTGAGGHPALKKKFVRQAIVTGINRLQIRQVVYRDIAPNLPPLNNAIYKNFEDDYVSHKYQPFGFSQRKAIELLRSNGCTGGPARPTPGNRDIYSCPGVGKLEFDFYSTSGNQARELVFQIVQAQLRSIGIQVNSKFSLTALTVTLPTKKWDIMLFAWIGSPDPGGSVNIHRCGGTQNYNDYCNRQVSRLLLRANETIDATRRARLMNEADRLMATDSVTLPMFARPVFLIHDRRVRGALLNPTNSGPTWNAENWAMAG